MNRHQVEAAVVSWFAPQAPEGGKVEAFNQGHRGRSWAHTWEVYISDAADETVAHLQVWTTARQGVVTLYSLPNHVFLGEVKAAPKHGATIRLSQTAPWNTALKNPYRTRYAEAGGRYFRVAAEDLKAPWFVDEIRHDGTTIRGLDGIAMNLDQARSMIAAEMGQDPEVAP